MNDPAIKLLAQKASGALLRGFINSSFVSTVFNRRCQTCRRPMKRRYLRVSDYEALMFICTHHPRHIVILPDVNEFNSIEQMRMCLRDVDEFPISLQKFCILHLVNQSTRFCGRFWPEKELRIVCNLLPIPILRWVDKLKLCRLCRQWHFLDHFYYDPILKDFVCPRFKRQNSLSGKVETIYFPDV